MSSTHPDRPRTKAGQREATRRKLIAIARERFARDGYAQISLSAIVEDAGVTKGALYHHFENKEALFRAVLQDVHEDVAARVGTAAPDADPWTQLIVGCETFLRASTDPAIQRIMLIDAPAVLGWDAWRELDAASSMQLLEDVMSVLIDTGEIPDQPVMPLVHLLSGAMNEAALWIAQSDNRERDLADTMSALTRLLESLRT